MKWLLISSARPYDGMPDSAGIVSPAAALLMAAQGNIGTANEGLTPAQAINRTTMTTQWAQSYWDQSYWDQSYWDQSYWDASSGYDVDASYDFSDID
jgi:hypothetical protein